MARMVRGLCAAACVLLAGCAGPISQREAQGIAGKRLARYCNSACGTITLARAQRIKDRWLVDFDAPRQKFTVTVEADGNSKVDIWSK